MRRQLATAAALPTVLGALLLAGTGCSQASADPGSPGGGEAKPAQPTPAEPRGTWVEARLGTIRSTTPAVGTLRARRSTRVAAQVGGRVLEVEVDVGDRVKAGDALVTIDPLFYEIEAREREAGVAVARAALAEAKLQHERMKTLWEQPQGERPLIARKQLDDALAQLDGAKARLELAEEQLSYARAKLRETVVRAPYDGVVTARLVHPGASVTTAPVTELLEVQETGVLHLEFALPQRLLGRVRPGTPVAYDLDPQSPARGTGAVTVVFPGVDEATRTFRARVVVENGSGALRPGMLLNVDVVTAEHPSAVIVPRAALAEPRAGKFEVTVAAGAPRAVEVGLATEAEAEILSGLDAGERVLLRE